MHGDHLSSSSSSSPLFDVARSSSNSNHQHEYYNHPPLALPLETSSSPWYYLINILGSILQHQYSDTRRSSLKLTFLITSSHKDFIPEKVWSPTAFNYLHHLLRPFALSLNCNCAGSCWFLVPFLSNLAAQLLVSSSFPVMRMLHQHDLSWKAALKVKVTKQRRCADWLQMKIVSLVYA